MTELFPLQGESLIQVERVVAEGVKIPIFLHRRSEGLSTTIVLFIHCHVAMPVVAFLRAEDCSLVLRGVDLDATEGQAVFLHIPSQIPIIVNGTSVYVAD